MNFNTQSLQTRIEQSWQRKDWLSTLLSPFSLVYGGVVLLRKYGYFAGVLTRYRAPVPVIIVGNITVGGSGKTPLVVHLVGELMAANLKPAVISRGYGGNAKDYPLLVERNTPASESGDEPALIARRTGVPVVVGANRQQSIEYLMREHDVDVIVSDDGLQHLKMARDVEICVVDKTRAGNNYKLLPAGPYREPISRLSSVDLLVHHTTQKSSSLALEGAMTMQLIPAEVVPLARDPAAKFDATQGVHAVAAIGHPERFFRTCEQLGWKIFRHAFPDHHQFCANDLDFGDALPVLMTEKDAVKCESFATPGQWYLPVDVKLSDSLIEQLKPKLGNLLEHL